MHICMYARYGTYIYIYVCVYFAYVKAACNKLKLKFIGFCTDSLQQQQTSEIYLFMDLFMELIVHVHIYICIYIWGCANLCIFVHICILQYPRIQSAKPRFVAAATCLMAYGYKLQNRSQKGKEHTNAKASHTYLCT